MKRLSVFLGIILSPLTVLAQFAPQAGISGSTAIPASSALFRAWATHCHISRGLKQIGNMAGGYATTGDSTSAIGTPDGGVVSLGDSGIAVLTFASPVIDGPGADFAVFENGFLNPLNGEEAFLELGFVEVSSDGQHYVRFPATSLTRDTFQMSSTAGSTYANARQLNNLAGKYVANYGTPFDLAELVDSPNLDVHHITHIRVIDCIGDVGSHAVYDAFGHKVNDPFPSPFPTGGFDLDAVGVINQSSSGIATVEKFVPGLFPNPASEKIHIVMPCEAADFIITDISGRVIMNGVIPQSRAELDIEQLCAGMYIIRITDKKGGQSWAGKLYRQ